MKIHASGEDYLEAILVLQKKMGMVRSIDLARHMGFCSFLIDEVSLHPQTYDCLALGLNLP